MKSFIRSEIARREAERATIRERDRQLDVELALLRDLHARAPGDEHRSTETLPKVLPDQDRGGSANGSEPRSAGGVVKGKGMSRRWAVVVAEAVRRYPDEITNADVPDIQRREGEEPANTSSVRSHFWGGGKAGLYERIGTARYRATEKAAEAVGNPLGGKRGNIEQNGSTSAENEEGSEDIQSTDPSRLFAGAA